MVRSCPSTVSSHRANDAPALCTSTSSRPSAASIVAKVARDRIMVAAAESYPQYDWASNKGYPTPDHLRALAESGETAVVLFPIGFISDHLEVIWDLDNEAEETAGELGLAFARAATAGTHPAFVASLRELLVERRAGGEPRLGTNCPASCCFVQRPARPTA